MEKKFVEDSASGENSRVEELQSILEKEKEELLIDLLARIIIDLTFKDLYEKSDSLSPVQP